MDWDCGEHPEHGVSVDAQRAEKYRDHAEAKTTPREGGCLVDQNHSHSDSI